MSEERQLQFNPRSGYYEGWAEDGRLVMVQQPSWRRMRGNHQELASPLSPGFWVRKQDAPGVCVFGPQTFQAMIRRAPAGSIICTTNLPVTLRTGELYPKAYARATPLGFGIKLVFDASEGEASLAGHIQEERIVHSLLRAHGLTDRDLWEAAEAGVKGIPLPGAQAYRDTFPPHEISQLAEKISALLWQSIVVERSAGEPAEILDERDPSQLDFATGRFPGLAEQIGTWFLQEHLPSPEDWVQSYGSDPRPTGEELAHLVEAVLWQRYWEGWTGLRPTRDDCERTGLFLLNLLFQLVRPGVFVS